MSPRTPREDLPAYARQLNAARELKGWTVERLAEAIPPAHQYGLSKSTLDKVSAGRRPLREHEYTVLAQVLNVPEWFLRDGLDERAREVATVDHEVADAAASRHDELVRRLDAQAEVLRVLTARVDEIRSRLA